MAMVNFSRLLLLGVFLLFGQAVVAHLPRLTKIEMEQISAAAKVIKKKLIFAQRRGIMVFGAGLVTSTAVIALSRGAWLAARQTVDEQPAASSSWWQNSWHLAKQGLGVTVVLSLVYSLAAQLDGMVGNVCLGVLLPKKKLGQELIKSWHMQTSLLLTTLELWQSKKSQALDADEMSDFLWLLHYVRHDLVKALAFVALEDEPRFRSMARQSLARWNDVVAAVSQADGEIKVLMPAISSFVRATSLVRQALMVAI